MFYTYEYNTHKKFLLLIMIFVDLFTKAVHEDELM